MKKNNKANMLMDERMDHIRKSAGTIAYIIVSLLLLLDILFRVLILKQDVAEHLDVFIILCAGMVFYFLYSYIKRGALYSAYSNKSLYWKRIFPLTVVVALLGIVLNHSFYGLKYAAFDVVFLIIITFASFMLFFFTQKVSREENDDL